MKNLTFAIVIGGLFIVLAGLQGSSQAAESKPSFQIGGSFRGRFESFSFAANDDGSKKDSRNRLRYRLRLDGKATVNSHTGFYLRLVSSKDSRSGNTTLGDPSDFAPNELTIRYAAMTYSPWAGGALPNGQGKLSFDFGRVKNPFRWKGRGKDMMVWDGDIALAGVGTQFEHKLGDSTNFFARTGYYAIDESSKNGADPFMVPLQLGLVFGDDGNSAGLRGTFYHMADLDADFISRGVNGENLDGSSGATKSGGNISDGLTGDADGGELQVIETQGFLAHNFGETPVVLYGGYSSNTSAEASQMNPQIGANANAYNLGLEAGSKKKMFLLGAGWFHIEANAFPSQFTDSDLLDGITNREGVLIYLAKSIMKNTDFNVQFYRSDAIESDTIIGNSVFNAERDRFQVDMTVKF